ncbi:hypothetical protein JTE90_006206 [Oedothorax gibbosus]|uniref:Uncharacterized protein n=1 Tax=Oedothorax gibbosus TaxID=931172 RepID=A0AAV6VWV5_9ARAC|nr:hypothetical protein JTE90_006206 [Oedothorax gibbosus]
MTSLSKVLLTLQYVATLGMGYTLSAEPSLVHVAKRSTSVAVSTLPVKTGACFDATSCANFMVDETDCVNFGDSLFSYRMRFRS